MSLITRCPACGTMFKVVPDQLRISEGWVRCGHCSEVFDASAHLQVDDPGDASADPPTELAGPAPVAAAEDEPASENFSSSLNTGIDEGMPSEAPDSAQLEAEAQAMLEHPLDRPFELRRQDAGEWAPQPRTPQPPLEPEPELHDLSFVRQARQREFWGRPAMRVLALLALVALGLMLALQFVVHDRNRLAASEPALRPWLAKLCLPLDCRIGPPRQIDAIAIDSSSFNKLRADSYRLNVTLKNQGSVDVAMPALELTLTDGQDQPVVRRVLMPAELGIHPGVIAAASEWPVSLALGVAANGNRVAGYRLLAFYP